MISDPDRRALAAVGGNGLGPWRSLALVAVAGLAGCASSGPGEPWIEAGPGPRPTRAGVPLPTVRQQAAGESRDESSAVPSATSTEADEVVTTEPNDAASFEVVELEGDLSLDQVLTAVLASEPGLRAAESELAARRADAEQAGRSPNPTLSVELEDFAGSGGFAGFDAVQTTVWLAAPLERGGKREARSERARVELQAADLEREALFAELVARIEESWWRAIAAEDRLALAREAEATAREVLSAVRERVAAGKVSPVEERKYTIAHTSASLELEASERRAQAARAALRANWGGTVEFGALLREPAEGLLEPPPSLSELERAVESSTHGRALELEHARRRAEEELARSNTAQDWELRVGIRRFEDSEDTAAVFGIDLPLPVADSGRDSLRAARERRIGGVQAAEAARRRMRADVRDAWLAASLAHRDAERLELDLLPEARRVFDAVDEGYREGRFDLIDLLDAQRTLFDARADSIRARLELRLALTEIRRLTHGS